MNASGFNAVDRRVLEKLEAKIGRKAFLEIAALFRQAAAARIAELEDIRARRDFAALRKIAHDWISDSAALGAAGLSALARRVEADALGRNEEAFATSREMETLAAAASAAIGKIAGEAA